MTTTREEDGWLLVEPGPAPADARRVLLMPGLLCTDLIYAEMLADPDNAAAGVQLVAADPPGFKGQPVPPGFDFRVESYAELVEQHAQRGGYELLVGHSFFGNVLIEVAARGRFDGKLMLISPSLYRKAEPNDTRTLDKLSRIPLVSELTWRATYALLRPVFKPYFTAESRDRLDAVVAEARRTPRAVCRELLLSLFDHLDAHGDLTARLAATSVPVWYLRGVEDNICFPAEIRQQLDRAAAVEIKDIAGSRHFAMLDQPRQVNALIRELLAS